MSTKNKQTVKISGFGERFRDAFKNKFGFTKNVEIAEKLKVSDVAVGNYIADRVPQLPILLEIVKLTDCSLDWLLLGNETRNDFNIEKFGGRYKFSKNQIESLKEISDRYKETLEEVVARGAKNALSNDGLIDDEDAIELTKNLYKSGTYQKESRSITRIIRDAFKDETIKKEVMELLKPEIQKIFTEQLDKLPWEHLKPFVLDMIRYDAEIGLEIGKLGLLNKFGRKHSLLEEFDFLKELPESGEIAPRSETRLLGEKPKEKKKKSG